MKITIGNYEAFALDYLEGTLGHQQKREFEVFLDQNPEIKEELTGLNEIKLSPLPTFQYPHKDILYRKEVGRVIPMWRINRLVAAAIAILLVSTAVFLVMNSQDKNPGVHITDNNSPVPQTGQEDSKQIAIQKPVPVEQSETNVMAQKGNVSGQKDHSDDRSPVLTFEQEKKENIPVATENIKNVENTEEVIAQHLITDPEARTLDSEPDQNFPDAMQDLNRNAEVEVVALLPVSSNAIATSRTLETKNLGIVTPEESDNTFEIRIPGQFLSETWTDVSFASFKNKILPEIFNKD